MRLVGDVVKFVTSQSGKPVTSQSSKPVEDSILSESWKSE
jgi:hypothetical protein